MNQKEKKIKGVESRIQVEDLFIVAQGKQVDKFINKLEFEDGNVYEKAEHAMPLEEAIKCVRIYIQKGRKRVLKWKGLIGVQ